MSEANCTGRLDMGTAAPATSAARCNSLTLIALYDTPSITPW